jgi:hypothetical protein
MVQKRIVTSSGIYGECSEGLYFTNAKKVPATKTLEDPVTV